MHQAPGSDRHACNGRSFIIANGDGCVRLDDVAGSSGIQGVNVAMGNAHAPVRDQRRHRDKNVQKALPPRSETCRNGVRLAPVDLCRR